MQHGHPELGLALQDGPARCLHPAGCFLCPQVSLKWITSRWQHSMSRALAVLGGE